MEWNPEPHRPELPPNATSTHSPQLPSLAASPSPHSPKPPTLPSTASLSFAHLQTIRQRINSPSCLRQLQKPPRERIGTTKTHQPLTHKIRPTKLTKLDPPTSPPYLMTSTTKSNPRDAKTPKTNKGMREGAERREK